MLVAKYIVVDEQSLSFTFMDYINSMDSITIRVG